MRVPRFDPCIEDAPVQDRIHDAINRVLCDGRFIDGPWVSELEQAISRQTFLSCVTVASGTDALTLALMAAVGPGKARVAVPSATFSATASAVIRAGMEPVLVDVDDVTHNIDWDQVKSIEGDIDAVIPVHLYGRVDPIPELRIPVIEDACQAFGVGLAGGLLAAYSFFPSKPLGCYGDGGALVGKSVDKVRTLARHGATTRYDSQVAGFNSRLDSIQAAILYAKLDRVRAARERRAAIAQRYNDAIGSFRRKWLMAPAWSDRHAWHIYALRCEEGSRSSFMAHMKKMGIDVAVQYPPLHRQRAFENLERASTLARSDALGRQVVSLPVWSGMTDAQVDHVITSIGRC